MFNEVKKIMQWGEETLTLETGKSCPPGRRLRHRHSGRNLRHGERDFRQETKAGSGLFPADRALSTRNTTPPVKIPGGFFKREARPTEKETLTSRLIDRPIRPLFVPGFKNEVLVICTVLSHDLVNDPDMVAMIAASAALTISGAPFMGPIGCLPRWLLRWRIRPEPERRRHAQAARKP